MLACLSAAMWLPGSWQGTQLGAIAAFFVLGRFVPALRPSASWRAKGTVPRGWTALVGGVTPVALWGWVLLMHPNLRDVVGLYVPDYPLPVLLVGAVGFAALNATLEEVIYRGVLQACSTRTACRVDSSASSWRAAGRSCSACCGARRGGFWLPFSRTSWPTSS
jgi:membrane protease YdiL (CAAX protease family)